MDQRAARRPGLSRPRVGPPACQPPDASGCDGRTAEDLWSTLRVKATNPGGEEIFRCPPSLWTSNEGSSSGGPLGFSARSNQPEHKNSGLKAGPSLPRPQKPKEKPAGLKQQARCLHRPRERGDRSPAARAWLMLSCWGFHRPRLKQGAVSPRIASELSLGALLATTFWATVALLSSFASVPS